MSQSTYAEDLTVIKPEILERLVPKQLAVLKMTLNAYGIDLEQLAISEHYEDAIEDATETQCEVLWDQLVKVTDAFHKLLPDLTLELRWVHDEDMGDMEHGEHWVVHGVYTLSEGGAVLYNYTDPKQSITWG